MLFDIVKERSSLPISLVIKDVHVVQEAAVCSGGMADIYHVRRKDGGDILALKVQRGMHLKKAVSPTQGRTNIDESDNPQQEACKHDVYSEALVWRQLKHKNILPLLGIVYDIPYKSSIGLLAPWMENGSLDGYLRKNETVDRLTIVRTSRYFARATHLIAFVSAKIAEIASALRYLHDQEPAFIHGDLRAVS